MTTDVEMLPLPDELQGRGKSGAIKDYARAVAEHNVAARDAEIKALRAELDEHKRRANAYFQTAERQGKSAERWEKRCEEEVRQADALREQLREMRAALRDQEGMDDLIKRLRRAKLRHESGYMKDVGFLLSEAADALEAAQMGLRYAVRVWVLADEIEWSEAEIDEAVERIIGYAKKEARNG